MLSAVVHARLEGEGAASAALSEAELRAFFSLLFTAGSETTGNSIAGGVVALLEHRAELEGLLADPALLPTAVEEILRWTSATAYNRRTATRDVELGGQPTASARSSRAARSGSCSRRCSPTWAARSSPRPVAWGRSNKHTSLRHVPLRF